MPLVNFSLQRINEITARYLFKAAPVDRRRLWNKLGRMIGNQMPIIPALEELRSRRVDAGGAGHPEAIAIAEWLMVLRNGGKLAEAIHGWVSVPEQMRIAAGESSGTLEQTLYSTAHSLTQQARIVKTIRNGLAYPAILVAAAFSVLYIFGFKIVPTFNNIVPPDRWKGLARAMVNVSEFSNHWLLYIIAAFVILLVLFFATLSTFDGKIRVFLDRYLPYSIFRVTQGSNWMLATAALIQAGQRTEIALEQMAKVSSPWLRRRIESCLVGIRSGYNMGDALKRSEYNFPDPEIIADLRTYATISGFDRSLELVANEWLTESVEQIESRMGAVFVICILVVALLVAFMVGGLMDMQIQMAKVLQSSYR